MGPQTRPLSFFVNSIHDFPPTQKGRLKNLEAHLCITEHPLSRMPSALFSTSQGGAMGRPRTVSPCSPPIRINEMGGDGLATATNPGHPEPRADSLTGGLQVAARQPKFFKLHQK